MATQEKLRNSILRKVRRLSEDKLRNLDSYIDNLESHPPTKRSILSYSGIFDELELDELTTGLHDSRADNNDRIPKF